MEIAAVIHVPSIEIASRYLLGLSVLARTLKSLDRLGVSPIFVVTPDPEKLKKNLPSVCGLFVSAEPTGLKETIRLSGSFHYDPDFIGWAVKNRIPNPHEKLKEIPEVWWEELSNDSSWKRAEKKLFAHIRAKTEGWVAPWINKPVSFFLTRFLVRANITPNQITFLNLLIALGGAWMMAGLDYTTRLAGAALMYFSSIVDGCDGEVARLKLQSSQTGAWFDTVADDIANNFFVVAVFVGLYRSLQNIFYLKAGLVITLMSLGVSLVIYQQLRKGSSANAKDFQPAWQKDKKSWFEFVRPLMKRDFFIAVIFVLMVLDLRKAIFWMAGGGAAMTFILYCISFTLSRRKEASL